MGIRMTINDTWEVTLDELITQLPNSKAAKEVAKLRAALQEIAANDEYDAGLWAARKAQKALE